MVSIELSNYVSSDMMPRCLNTFLMNHVLDMCSYSDTTKASVIAASMSAVFFFRLQFQLMSAQWGSLTQLIHCGIVQSFMGKYTANYNHNYDVSAMLLLIARVLEQLL